MSFGVVAASYLEVIQPSTPTVVGIAQDSRADAGSLTINPPVGASGYIAVFSGYFAYGLPVSDPDPPSGWTC